MKLNVKHTQHIDIEIDELTRKSIVLNYIKEKFNWEDDYFIEDDKVCNIQQYRTSHSWDRKEIVRKATDIDKYLYWIVKKIKEMPL